MSQNENASSKKEKSSRDIGRRKFVSGAFRLGIFGLANSFWMWPSKAEAFRPSIGFWKQLRQPEGLFAWGSGAGGRLGGGNTTNRSAPTQIGLENNWSKIAAGISHSLAVKNDGTLWSWGGNGSGQLGNNTTVNAPLRYR